MRLCLVLGLGAAALAALPAGHAAAAAGCRSDPVIVVNGAKVAYVYSAAQPWGSLRVDATVQTQAATAPFATGVQVTTLLDGIQHAGGLSTSTVSVTIAHQLML